MTEIKTALERFQAYCKSKGIPEKSSLAHIHKIGQFEEHERKELRAAYEALQKENAFLINDLHIARSHVGTLKAENVAQAKRIAELEEKMPETLVINADTNLTISGSKESIHAMNGLALEAMELRAKVAELDNKLHERTITSGAKIHELNAEIESLRKQVEAPGQTAPTASGFCSRDGGCVCGGDLPRIRESCGSWVKPASKNGE